MALASAAAVALAAATTHPLLAAAAVALVALNWKTLPLVYHGRIAALIAGRVLRPRRLPSVGAPVVWRDRVLLCDMDYNMHQNNSLYYLVADFARTELILALYAGDLGAYRRQRFHHAATCLYFLRELRFLDAYTVRARLVSVDDKKWGYVLLEYINDATGVLHCIGLTRFVLGSIAFCGDAEDACALFNIR